jgi:hypothetical protein
MPRRKRGFNHNTHKKRLKEGRGQGDGAYYQPYIRVQDLSSLGQCNRDLGLTTNRQHDLFSKLEHRSYLIYDVSKLLDIKEQKDIPLDLTLEIARECGIRHPATPITKIPIPLTIDLVLTIPRPVGSVTIARSIKYVVDLSKPRAIEKLELQRRSCRQLYADWGIITENDFDWALVKNILWSYKFREVRSLYPLRPDKVSIISRTLTTKVLARDVPLCEAALLCDRDFDLRRGTSLSIARHLIASGQWVVDMRTLIVTTERLDIRRVALSAD